jgi:uncharacterized protein (TIGR02246 family)
MRVQNLGWVAAALLTSLSAWSQSAVDEAALKRLPETFSSAWASHQGSELAKIVSEDVDFVNVGAIWLRGRTDFDKYHTRILQGRFKHSTNKPLETHVRFLRPDLALVRWSWQIDGETDAAGVPLPARYGLMTFVAERRSGTWLVIAAQNTNAGPARPEASDITSPIKVPRNP